MQCKQAKEERINKRREETEDLEKKDIHMMYSKVESMTRPRTKPGNIALKDKDGNVIVKEKKHPVIQNIIQL